jgi:hypothetical protein
MKSQMIALSLAGAIAYACPAQDLASTTATHAAIGRVVRVERMINAPVMEVWRVFTTSEGAKEFFAVRRQLIFPVSDNHNSR